MYNLPGTIDVEIWVITSHYTLQGKVNNKASFSGEIEIQQNFDEARLKSTMSFKMSSSSSYFQGNKDFIHLGLRAAITDKISSYGTAITVGVFIGTALTTGIAAGIAGWYFANKMAIQSKLSSLTSIITSNIGTDQQQQQQQKKKEQKEQEQTLAELTQRIVSLESNFRILNDVKFGSESKTEVEL